MRRVVKAAPLALSLGFIGLLAFSATAFAANAVASPDTSILDLARPVFNAFSGGHYAYAAALGIILLVAVLKKASARYLGDKVVKALHSDAGGSALALAGAAATAMSAGLAAPGATVTFSLLKSALLVGVGAAGGYAVLKNLVIEPILKPLASKAPAWAQPIFTLVFWIFDKPDSVLATEANAAAAGEAAVKANPSPGVAEVLGQPTEVK